ncbi:MAG: SLBB domain-containing protein [Burkholderiales bacterium]|nr:SLBB domain-containing protein [Burkholderiales bacterium]
MTVKRIICYLLCIVNCYLYADETNSYGFGSGNSSFNTTPASATGTMVPDSFNNNSSGVDDNTANSTLYNSSVQFGNSIPQINGSDVARIGTQQNNFNKLNASGSASRSLNSSNNKTTPNSPDEFQLSVRIRTGLMLPKYGYNLFANPLTFTPVSDAPASSNYILGPGDRVSIKAWGSVDISYMAEVDKAGNIFIPKVGQINLTGVRAGELDSYLKGKVSRIYRNFSLYANVSQVRSIQVVVAGFAKQPGTYTVSSLSTLTDAVFASGGPAMEGSLRHIQLKRSGVVIADYDMYDLLLSGNSSHDTRLLSGDVIYIKPHGREVAIYDGVKVPAIYETRDEETVADIVKFAGGYTFNNTKKQIIIETMDENKQINVTNFDFAQGMKQPLMNGEIIHFFKAPNSYKDAVVLIGNVANPSRFSWHQGLTIKDVIPNKELLLTKTFWNSYSTNSYAKDNFLERLGVEKTNNWSAKDQSSSQFTSGLSSKGVQEPQMSLFKNSDNLFTAGPVAIPEADINWHYAVVIRINPETFHSELIPFDLALAIAGNSKDNLELKPGDIINVLSSRDVRSPSKKDSIYVFIDGEVNGPGVYEMPPGAKLLDVINKAGNITDEAYIYGIELDRDAIKKRQKAALNQMLDNVQQSLLAQANNAATTSSSSAGGNMTQQVLSQQQAFIDKLRQLQPTGRIIFNLRNNKVALKDLPNVTLENGDTIYIPPTPSTVDVVGQVFNPATFMYNEGFTLSDYLDAAGTPNQFADTGSIYVLHADGTLYSKQQAGWFGAFGSKRLYAGDAIVVPQTIEFMSLQQNLINWTQVLANFGLGVAAIHQLGN